MLSSPPFPPIAQFPPTRYNQAMEEKTRRAVIIGAAAIGDYKRIASYLRPDSDFYIFCDGGLHHWRELERQLGRPLNPHLVVGDFDSHQVPNKLSCPVVRLPCEKDDTDTWFAAKEAIRQGFREFLLVGAAGQRLDHTMANISILLHLHSLGLPARLIDDFSEMEIVGKSPVKVGPEFSYFSLLNVSGMAKHVTIRNAQYPLERAEIHCSYQYAVSNQVLPGKAAEITVGQGSLLLLRVF